MVDYQELTAFVTKIKSEYEQDCNWDGLNTQSFILALSGKVAKYISYWTKLKNLYLKVDEEYNKLYINLYMEYKDGNINYTQGEIKDLLPKNQELAEIVKLKTAFISAIEMVEKYVDNLNKTRYDVTNYIEIQKFLNGK